MLCALVLTTSLVVRMSVAVWWQQRLEASSQRFAMGDSESYWILAGQLAADQPYFYNTPEASVFRTPGYPWLLSWIVDPGGPGEQILQARIMGCVFGTLAVAICMILTAGWFDRASSLVCGVLASFYPGAITTSVLVLSEAPFMPLMMLILTALCLAIRRPEQASRWSAIAGLLSGLAILIRPSWLLFMPFYYLCRFLITKEKAREFKLAVIAGASIAAVMTPWWLRNYQVTGQFVLTTLQVGPSLYDGLSPEATGGSDSGMLFSGEFASKLRASDAADPGPKDNFEYRLNKKLASAATEWAIENPGTAILLGFRKFYRTWWPLPSVEEIPGGFATRIIFAVGMLGIVIPAISQLFCGSVANKKMDDSDDQAASASSNNSVSTSSYLKHIFRTVLSSKNEFFPIVMPVIYFTCLHTIFVGSIRYRQPAVFVLTVLAAPQLVHWARQLFGKNRS